MGFKSRKEIEDAFLKKSNEEPEFRNKLIQDPKGTLESELNVKLPENFNVTVLEEKANDFYFVLPLNPELPLTGELSEEQLEQVAGGSCYFDCGCDVNCDS